MDKNTIRICGSVVGQTIEQFQNNLKLVDSSCDMVELRLDTIDDFDKFHTEQIENHLKNFKSQLTKPTILTCRSKKDGGNFRGNQAKQIDILQLANDLGYDFVDIDLRIYSTVDIKAKKVKTIISFHDFEKTPIIQEFVKLYEQMRATDANIYKFAVKVNKPSDLNIIYRVIVNKGESENVIAIGMGELGSITRIVCPILGSYLTFAAVGKSSSAPGQIDVGKMREIYNNLPY